MAFQFKISDRGIALLKKYESCKLKAYPDGGGVLTIGWGTTNSVLPKEFKIVPGQCISQETADKYLLDALNNIFVPGVNKLLKVAVSQEQFDALVSFAYNVGLDDDADTIAEGLGDSTLLRKVNAGDFVGAQREFLKWNKDNGQEQRGLTRRRLDEAVMFGPLSRIELITKYLGGVDPDIKPKK